MWEYLFTTANTGIKNEWQRQAGFRISTLQTGRAR